MSHLKLVALDEKDLEIVSAHVQDAVMKVGDLSYKTVEKRFVVPMNRFVWEVKPRWFSRSHERRRSVLHFERVLSAKIAGFAQAKRDEVLSLLALRFEPGEAPGGVIELVFAAGATVRLEVEVIEARLADLGAAWETTSRPLHKS